MTILQTLKNTKAWAANESSYQIKLDQFEAVSLTFTFFYWRDEPDIYTISIANE
jgi:hypothetical protein